jgi:hypothetical protein
MSVQNLIDMKVTEFHVDPSVQRQLNEPRVAKLSKEFNPRMLGLITATKRLDGRCYVLDGQHRIAAARVARYDGYVATRLYENLTVAEEAQLFLDLNDTRKVSALDKFLVRATMGDPSAVALRNALERFGLKVTSEHKGGSFAAIVALERVYAGFMSYSVEPRLDLVESVLQILTKAYSVDERAAFQANTVQGVGLILQIFGKQVDADDLVAALRSITPDALAVKGRSTKDLEGGTGAQGVAKIILSLYNKGKSSRRLDFADFNDGLALIRKIDKQSADRVPAGTRKVDGRGGTRPKGSGFKGQITAIENAMAS